MTPTKLIAKQPTGGTRRDWEFPTFERTRLDSGMQLITVHAPGRPLAACQLIIEAGAACEPDRQGGVAFLAARALTEGTGRNKGSAFIQAVERLGADIFATCGWDSFTVNLRTPISRLEPALELMAEAVRDPEFAASDVERLKQQRVGGILQEYAGASTRATIAFNRAVYSKASPYSYSAHGEFWSVMGLTKGRARKYYEQFGTPGSATLIVCGDLEGAPIEKITEQFFGGWKGKEPQHLRPLVEEAVSRTSVLLVHREEAKQSQIDIGHVGVARSTPDYFPLIAMNAALGGMVNSRLNLRLREDKGYTYGAGSGFDFRRQAGPFRARAAVDTAVTVEAVAEALDVLQSTHDKGITKDELEQVKGYLIGLFPLRFETPEAIASAISSLVIYGLPEDYYSTYRTNVEKVTLDDVKQAAAERLHPDRMAIVVVGDADQVRDPLKRAGFGPVTVIEDPEGEPPTN